MSELSEIEILDKVFMYLFLKKDMDFRGSDLTRVIEGLQSQTQADRSLEHLHELGLVHKSSRGGEGMPPYSVYSISTGGISFMNALPEKYKEAPYSYYQVLKEEGERKLKEKDELDTKIKMLTLSFSKTQRMTTIGSFTVAALSLITTILIFINKPEKQYIPLQQQQQLMQTQEQINKNFQQYLDYLTKHQIHSDSSKMGP